MVSLQILSKILQSKSISIVEDNLLTEEQFVGYADEFNYILDHYKEYGNVPDTASFLSKFPEIELVEVSESDRYLVETLQEEYLYYRSIPVIQKAAELLKTDSNAASEYLIHALKDLEPEYKLNGVDIIADGQDRLDEYRERKNNQNEWFFTTGFEELDDLIHGLQRGEEFVVLFARLNQGKSWILEKICSHIWEIGFNVGFISPEMGAINVGYRFDTLYKHFSNKNLMWGGELDEKGYEEYIGNLKESDHKFIVSTPLDFNRKITVSKLRNWIKKYKLDMIAIDGITYLFDERGKRGDNKTTSLTNISEDLMSLSVEMGVPIVTVAQANRGGVAIGENDDVPELETIRDSDGIGYNASKVISIRQLKNQVLRMGIKKNRFGSVGGKLDYIWDIDIGDFKFLPSHDDAQPEEKTEEQVEKVRKKYKNDRREVF